MDINVVLAMANEHSLKNAGKFEQKDNVARLDLNKKILDDKKKAETIVEKRKAELIFDIDEKEYEVRDKTPSSSGSSDSTKESKDKPKDKDSSYTKTSSNSYTGSAYSQRSPYSSQQTKTEEQKLIDEIKARKEKKLEIEKLIKESMESSDSEEIDDKYAYEKEYETIFHIYNKTIEKEEFDKKKAYKKKKKFDKFKSTCKLYGLKFGASVVNMVSSGLSIASYDEGKYTQREIDVLEDELKEIRERKSKI
ncbi:MAG: hypothetical protein RR420_01465 [Anaerovoracaceae bacterium]